MENWPQDNPLTLQSLCLNYLVDNYLDLTRSESMDDINVSRSLIEDGELYLPTWLCDGLLAAFMERQDREQDCINRFVSIFHDTTRTKFKHVNLQNSQINNTSLALICNHPLIELDISGCDHLERRCVPSIVKCGSTLKILKLDNTEQIWLGSMTVVNYGDGQMPGHQIVIDHDQIEPRPRQRHHAFHNEEDEDPSNEIYEFFIGTKFTNLRYLSLYKSISSIIPSSMEKLQHLDLSGCSITARDVEQLRRCTELVWLSVADVAVPPCEQAQRGFYKALGALTTLRHLDVSLLSVSNSHLLHLSSGATVLQQLLSTLPNVTSLDISGTSLAGVEPPQTVTHRLQPAYTKSDVSEPPCTIPCLKGRHFEFLGLFDCLDKPCERQNIPADKVTGNANDEQILLALKVYSCHAGPITRVLNTLFDLYRESPLSNHYAVLDGILMAMEAHPYDHNVQISGSATIFYIVKSDIRLIFTHLQRRRVVKAIVGALSRHLQESTMLRNGCLTLCYLEIPRDIIGPCLSIFGRLVESHSLRNIEPQKCWGVGAVTSLLRMWSAITETVEMFCYQQLVEILLRIMTREQHEDFVNRLCVYLLNSVACQIDHREKLLLGNMGLIGVMVTTIKGKLRSGDCGEIMRCAWSTLWNVTDETSTNCEEFLNLNGMTLFLECIEAFPDEPELIRNTMGLMGNVAEVQYLRPRLMEPTYISAFSTLLTNTDDGLEISYNAAGVLAHIMADPECCWADISEPTRQVVRSRMVDVVTSWNIKAERNINYRSFEPIMRLLRAFHSPESQLWATWALCNLSLVYPDKYCSLIESEGGIPMLEQLIADPRPNTNIKHFATMTLDTCGKYKRGELNAKDNDIADNDLR